MSEASGMHREMRDVHRILVGKLKEETTYKIWARWVNNIKTDLKAVNLWGIDWNHVIEDRVLW